MIFNITFLVEELYLNNNNNNNNNNNKRETDVWVHNWGFNMSKGQH